jgi:predicted  nucleic acid-binding Zn-ribbon protein
MLDLIWNLFQDDDIKRLRSGVASREEQSDALRSHVGSVEARLLELEKRHEQLKLVTLALWRLLKDRGELSELNLKKYVESTDLLDGEPDGKVDLTKELIKCPDCGRFLLNTAIVCPYCGANNASGNAFDTV